MVLGVKVMTLPYEAAKERDIFCLSFSNNTRGAHDSNRKGVKKCGMWRYTEDWGSLRRCLKFGRLYYVKTVDRALVLNRLHLFPNYLDWPKATKGEHDSKDNTDGL